MGLYKVERDGDGIWGQNGSPMIGLSSTICVYLHTLTTITTTFNTLRVCPTIIII